MNHLIFLVILVGLIFSAPESHAWKIETHLWLADQLWSEVRTNDTVQLPVGQFSIPQHLRTAVINNRGPFLMGVLGPDTYPDMIAGQFTTHPGLEVSKDNQRTITTAAGVLLKGAEPSIRNLNEQANLLTQGGPDCFRSLRVDNPQTKFPLWQTDDWLCWVRHRALATKIDGRETAFAYGYLMHAAMDMWAHSYVNLYAGDSWSLKEEQEVELRHMGIESVVARTHKNFPEEPESLTQEASAAQLAQQLREYAGRIQGFASERRDALTLLKAPVDFVRKELVLNPAVANQYAREDMTTHLFAMYVYWAQVKAASARLQPLRDSIHAAAENLSQGLAQAQTAFDTAQSAYNAAVQAADAAYDTFKKAEKAADAAADQFARARKAAFGAIDAITDQMVAMLPPSLKGPYETAKKARDAAFDAVKDRKKDYENLVKTRDDKKKAMQQALETFNVRNTAHTMLNQARNQTLGAIDAGIGTWRTGIEHAVDAYILAWEDTSKELMRFPGARFAPGHNVTEPLKQWAICWGPTFGLPVLTSIAPVCDTTRSGYVNAKNNFTNLKLLAQNAAIPQHVRQAIESFDMLLTHTSGWLVVETGKLVSRAVSIDNNGLLGGHSRSLINLRMKTPNAQEVDDEFDDNTAGSGKQLLTYPRFTQLISNDMGISHAALTQLLAQNPRVPTANMQSRFTLNQLENFSALQNSFVMAKLVLLDGLQLNAMTHPKTQLATYSPNAQAGEVLIGALRSIDGDHQWQKHAPAMPRRPPQQQGERSYGYDRCDSKGGLKLWQDEQIRTQVFNQLFKGPLTPSLVAFVGPGNLGPGIGTTTADPYPATSPPPSCQTTFSAPVQMLGTVQTQTFPLPLPTGAAAGTQAPPPPQKGQTFPPSTMPGRTDSPAPPGPMQQAPGQFIPKAGLPPPSQTSPPAQNQGSSSPPKGQTLPSSTAPRQLSP